MSIPLDPVDSSSVKAIGYNLGTKTLAVQFHNGAAYSYANVSPEKAQALRSAKSIGRHLMQHIMPKHKHTKL